MVYFRLTEMWGDEELFHEPFNHLSYRDSNLLLMQF